MNKKTIELKLNGNADNLTPYIFRNNYATILHNLGISDQEIQYLMGHSNIQTTDNWYIHMDLNHLDATVALENFANKRLN